MSEPDTANAAPLEYETGVSNGDVDWLFRGKSKKLTKKMYSQNPGAAVVAGHTANQAGNSSPPVAPVVLVAPESATVAPVAPVAPVAAPLTTLAAQGAALAAPPTPHTERPRVETRVPRTASPPSPRSSLLQPLDAKPRVTISENPALGSASTPSTPVDDKPSKRDVFRLGRHRSASDSTQLPPRRRSSLAGLIASSSQPLQLPPASQLQLQPPSNDELQSPGVSRSNSIGNNKRSLFSSISSKFKSSNASQTNTSGQRANSADLSSPLELRKPLINLLGVSGQHQQNNQDLAALVNRPPNGIPQRKRSTSNSAAKSHQGGVTQLQAPAATPPQTKPATEVAPNFSLRRVTFAVDKLAYDPQQQIPSRRPRKGNVLIPEDLIAPTPRLSQGISLADSKHPGGTIKTASDSNKCSDKEYLNAVEAQRRALVEAEKHAHEAHLAASRIAHEVAQYKCKTTAKDQQAQARQEEEEAERDAEHDRLLYEQHEIAIDKPLHVHEHHFQSDDGGDSDRDKYVDDRKAVEELTLECIYTRCCHLREILPIPATLKQLKNKTKPLQVLKLLNPKPTLIDVLSFSDFIAITPINTVIFDNVTMTTEMLRHFLSSLLLDGSLEKLSLRNVAIDAVGWELLCRFMAQNKTVKKLDISQQKIKCDLPISQVRSSMNWSRFIGALVQRGGVEELVINGCKLPDATFTKLIEAAVKPSTYRLGIAGVDLNVYKAEVVAQWMNSDESKCVGVDIAFNDLSGGQLQPFIKSFSQRGDYLKLLFFSLNSTKLTNIEEVGELLKALTKVTSLRFLDLSSLPDLFPGIISSLNKYLPLLKDLRRVHFDLNELSPHSIGAIAEILPKCETLVHVSFLGNRQLNHSSAGSLYSAVKASKTIFTLDLDYDLVSDELSQRIAFYLMRNMDKTMNNAVTQLYIANANDDEELMFDGSLLMETAEKLIAANDEEKKEDPKIQKLITNALIERTRAVRKDIHKTIDSLFAKRNQGVLSLEGKETLLRFCLLDNSLEKVINMFEERAQSYATITNGSALSPTTSIEQDIVPSISVSQGDGDNGETAPKSAFGVIANSLGLSLAPLDTLHESSSEILSVGPILSPHNNAAAADAHNLQGFDNSDQPHQVVVDSSDGKDVPTDYLTGRPVLMRSLSQTSAHAREQEQEEGELHKFGFFMQRRDTNDEDADPKKVPTLHVLPLGSELRDAIITAKGIESVTDLIDNINNNRVSLDKIYSDAQAQAHRVQGGSDAKSTEGAENQRKTSVRGVQPPPAKRIPEIPTSSNASDNVSIDSVDSPSSRDNLDDDKVNAVVDKVYEKLLNDAQRVRSNKQD